MRSACRRLPFALEASAVEWARAPEKPRLEPDDRSVGSKKRWTESGGLDDKHVAYRGWRGRRDKEPGVVVDDHWLAGVSGEDCSGERRQSDDLGDPGDPVVYRRDEGMALAVQLDRDL